MVKIHKYSPGIKRGWHVHCKCMNRKEMFRVYHEQMKNGIPINRLHLRKVGKIGDDIPYELWIRLEITNI